MIASKIEANFLATCERDERGILLSTLPNNGPGSIVADSDLEPLPKWQEARLIQENAARYCYPRNELVDSF